MNININSELLIDLMKTAACFKEYENVKTSNLNVSGFMNDGVQISKDAFEDVFEDWNIQEICEDFCLHVASFLGVRFYCIVRE